MKYVKTLHFLCMIALMSFRVVAQTNDADYDESFSDYLSTLPTIENVDTQIAKAFYHPRREYRNVKPGNRVEEDLAAIEYNKVSYVPIKLLSSAIKLCNKKNFYYQQEGEDKPAQMGLAYLWGGKDYHYRGKPSAGDSCRFQVYGLDCSGFIYTIFLEVGMPFIKGSANDQRQVTTIQKYLTQYLNTNAFDVTDIDSLDAKNIRPGDIVYFYKMLRSKDGTNKKHAYHIGIALKFPGSDDLYFVASNGKPNDCAGNLKKGPSAFRLDQGFKKFNYGVVRMEYK